MSSRREDGRFNRGRIATVVGSASPAPPYSPLDESSPLLWFDMLDATSWTESAGLITALTNKVSSVVYSDAFAPAYSATGLSGHPCMVGNGTNHKLMSAADSAVFTALNHTAGAAPKPYTLYIAGQLNVADAIRVLFSVANSTQAANGSRRWGTNTTGAGRMTCVTSNDSAGATVADAAASDDLLPHIWCWYSPGTTVSLQTDGGANDPNGAAQDPSAGSTAGMTHDRVGLFCRASSTPTTFGSAQIGEVLLYGADHDAAAITRVVTYLARWA